MNYFFLLIMQTVKIIIETFKLMLVILDIAKTIIALSNEYIVSKDVDHRERDVLVLVTYLQFSRSGSPRRDHRERCASVSYIPVTL